MLLGGKSPSVDFSHSKTSGFHGSFRSRGLIHETDRVSDETFAAPEPDQCR
jgi:hypothetical protein